MSNSKNSIHRFIFSISIIALIIGLSSFGNGGEKPSSGPIDVSWLDNSIKPGDDFFEYVNAKWITANPIPSTKSRWGAFNLLDENSKKTLRQIMEDDSKSNAAKGTIAQKVGDFWSTGMDSAAIDNAGILSLKSYTDMIEMIQTKDDLLKVTARLQKIGANVFFQPNVDADQKNSAMNILTLSQGGLGLPDRDYYLRTDSHSVALRTEYIGYIDKLFTLAGYNRLESRGQANNIMNIETEFAKSSMTLVEQRDPYATYNKMTVNDFVTKYAAINWKLYFVTMGYPAMNDLIIAQPKFFESLNKMIDSVSIEDWKKYLRFAFINNASNVISSDFEQANFDFYSTKLQGIQEMEPRWKRVSNLANGLLGEALGQEYVKRTFTPDAKLKMIELIGNLKIAFAQRIDQLDWMSAETKVKAKHKLDSITVKVGYPDKWKDYSSLQIDRSSFALNVFHCSEFEVNRNVAKANKPVDRSEWGMSPQTVNAYYNPSNNEIVFPAAILQPPFFDPKADNAVNYGGIGAVIGHEMTHGFDDQGRLYDAKGNLKDWWSDEDGRKFKEKTAHVSKYYSMYSPIDTLHINGDLTNGENIADQGGIEIAFTAFQKATERSGVRCADITVIMCGTSNSSRTTAASFMIFKSLSEPMRMATCGFFSLGIKVF